MALHPTFCLEDFSKVVVKNTSLVLPLATTRPAQSLSLGFSPFCHFYGGCPYCYYLQMGSTNRIRSVVEAVGGQVPFSEGLLLFTCNMTSVLGSVLAGLVYPPGSTEAGWKKAKSHHLRSSPYHWAGIQLTASVSHRPLPPLKMYIRK